MFGRVAAVTVLVAGAVLAVAAPASAATPTLQAPDGIGVYGQFSSNTVPTDPAFFPVGVWMEQYSRATTMQGHGVNMIVNTVGTPESFPAGMFNVGALEDEADMWAGPGSAAWTGNYPGQGNICSPAGQFCGFTVMQTHQTDGSTQPGAMRYTNYGKGVGFWDDDADAAKFVNQYQDTTSIDLYWGTDDDLCQASQGGSILGTGRDVPPAQCHKPANYGATVDRVRSLVQPAGSKPIFNYVELGNPQSYVSQMPLPEVKAAVWSSLIHGARGIVYFNHSFGGNCQSQHVIDDCFTPAQQQVVNRVDAQIRNLAPVLNSPSLTSGVTVSGSIDQTTRWDGRNLYVFAGSNANLGTGPATASVSIPCVGTARATVLGEGRTVQVVHGKITDTFADANAVHLYRINGGSTCGLT